MNLCFFSTDVNVTLFSLGYMQRHGGSYGPDPLRSTTHTNIFSSILLPPIDTPSLNRANLLPINFSSLSAAALKHPHLYYQPSASSFLNAIDPSLTPHLLAPLSSSPAPYIPPPAKYFNPEQRRRADEIQQLHISLFHPSDHDLSASLSYGKFLTHLTSSDVAINRALRGPCPQCLEGKHKHKPKPSSLSPPAQSPGEVLSFDPTILPSPSVGGYTHALFIVDEHTGFLSVVGSLSKSTSHVFDSFRNLITKVYNAHKHTVGTLHGDCEKINLSLAQPLGSIGCALVASPPNDHAQRVERHIQTIITICISMLASLPYYLPTRYILQLLQAAAHSRNSLVSIKTSPYTPNELVLHSRPTSPPIPFGYPCMVTCLADKRASYALSHNTYAKFSPKTEFGVCMGPDPVTGSTLFLLQNGLIVPRAPDHLLPLLTPFNWVTKAFVIPDTSSPPSSIALANTATTPLLNPVIQLPNSPVTSALRAISPIFVPSMPHPTLHAIRSLSHPTPLPHTTFPPGLVPPPSVPLTPPSPPSASPSLVPPIASLPLLPPLLIIPPQPDVPSPIVSILPAPNTLSSPLASTLAPSPPSATTPSPLLSTRVTRSQSGIAKPHIHHPSEGYHTRSRTLPSVPHPSSYFTNLISSIQPHSIRKLALAKLATTAHRNHFHQSHHTANNKPTTLIPIPLPRLRSEMTITRALKTLETPVVDASLAREMKKVQVSFASLKPITTADIEDKSAFLRCNMLVKEKRNKDVNSRLAIDGSQQPPDSYNSTHSGTSDFEKLLCLFSATIADASHRQVPLQLGSFDVPAAFIQCPLTRLDTNGYQLITRLPSNLPGPLAGQLNEIVGAHYGLKQSNNIFTESFRRFLVKNGYSNSILGPHVYRKTCPLNPKNYLIISMHVDDGSFMSTSPTLTAELKSILTAEYGSTDGHPLTWNDEITDYCGINFIRYADGSIKAHMGPHITKFLTKEGMDALPGALTPALADFFLSPSNSTPFNPDTYQSTQGGLLFLTPIRSDIKLFVNHLSSFNFNPCQSDRDKQIQIMRYLKAYPNEGPTFSYKSDQYPNGPQLSAAADCSFASLPNSQSLSGILYYTGDHTAAFASFASAEPGIALSPQEGEYLTMGRAAKQCIYWQQFLDGVGFPQLLPTIIREDNLPAINLVKAPEVTRHSRHMLIKHHYIRWLYQQGLILPIHQGTNDMSADFLTKFNPPRKFHYFKDKVFNAQQQFRKFLDGSTTHTTSPSI